jgi:2-dehydropantoate 2-reductase
MNILILGAGRIGSTFAFHLGRAGHAVTVVARGARLQALVREGAIVTKDGRRAAVRTVADIDPDEPFDLAIIAVPEHQVEPLLDPIARSKAGTVLAMFNSFTGTEQYRVRIGAQRFAAGFPTMIAHLEDQRLLFKVDGPGMATTVERPDLASLFAAAGLPSEVEPDMDAFLRSHVALAVPLFIAALWIHDGKRAITWREAQQLADLWKEGFDIVRLLGHPIRPAMVAGVAGMPRWLASAGIWAFSKMEAVRETAVFGPAETRALIDAMAAAAPGHATLLRAARP